MKERINEVLADVLERFKVPETLPRAIALATFPRAQVPCASWSLLNRIIIALRETDDARGIIQWNKVNRRVRRGARAVYILAPLIRTIKESEGNSEKEKIILRGFKAIPVFRIEDTEGDPIEYAEYEIPELPLLEKATEWGITVRTSSYGNRYLGCYRQKSNEIVLCSPEELVLFHELAHAAHKQVLGELIGGEDWRQEIVAELSAQALCYLVGKRPERIIGNSYRYIEYYADQINLSPVVACVRVLGDVEKVLTLILQ